MLYEVRNLARLFLLGLTGLATLPAVAQPAMPPAQVRTVPAEERLMAPQMDVSGTVISLNDSQISAEVEGPLEWIADVGVHVAQGEVIARIDDRLLKVAFDRATANLNRLEADLVFRNQEVDRFERLAAQDNASRARLQEVIARRNMLRHEIADAKATLERAEGDLARAEIKAPFSGHIVARLASIGEYMTVGEAVVRFVDTQNMEVVIPAPIGVAPFLKAGLEVTVLDARGSHIMPIRAVVPVGDAVSRMVEVRLTAKAEDWVVGTPVKVSLPKGEAVNSVAVPRDALVLKGSSVFVFKIKDDMTAEQVRADIASTVGLWVSLRSGVDVGEQVVVRGGERLQPGQSVVVSKSVTQ